MWLKVVCAGDCDECPHCGGPVCPVCAKHYDECECPGPTQDDLFEYMTDAHGVLLARRKE